MRQFHDSQNRARRGEQISSLYKQGESDNLKTTKRNHLCKVYPTQVHDQMGHSVHLVFAPHLPKNQLYNNQK